MLLRCSLLSLVVVLIFAGTAPSQAQLYPCGGLQVVEPTVRVEIGRVEEVRTRTINQLTASSGLGNALSSHSLGLSTSDLAYRSEHSIALQEERVGRTTRACASVAELSITVILDNRRIYIARELEANRCAFNFVRQHELKHQQVDEASVRKLANELRQRLTTLIIAVHHSKGRDGHALGEEMSRILEREVNRIWGDVVRQRNAAQAYIDRPDGDYAQVDQVCDGIIPRLTRRR